MTSIEEKIRRVKTMDSGGVVELLKKDSSEIFGMGHHEKSIRDPKHTLF